MLNERQDYFGQTVNIAARVQGLAVSRSIFASGQVIDNAGASQLLKASGLSAVPQECKLRGVAHDIAIYMIP
jgi:class 3 adenylate cyclase